MTLLLDLTRLLAFRRRSLRALAARRSLVAGLLLFSAGFLAFVLVRNSVYRALREPEVVGATLLDSITHLNLLQAILFLAFVYVPSIVALGNAVSGFGFSVSNREYRSHLSVLLPLWGILLLIAAPLQWLLPQFLVLGVLGISIGLSVLCLLILIYTVWAIKDYPARFLYSHGVFLRASIFHNASGPVYSRSTTEEFHRLQGRRTEPAGTT
jgi:hypothetical protein